MCSGIHLQAPARLRWVHSALAPHGEGLQGSTISGRMITSGIREQPLKGSPVYPEGQVQMALWFTAVHLKKNLVLENYLQLTLGQLQSNLQIL